MVYLMGKLEDPWLGMYVITKIVFMDDPTQVDVKIMATVIGRIGFLGHRSVRSVVNTSLVLIVFYKILKERNERAS